MRQRACGDGGLKLSELTLGLMVRDCTPGAGFDSVRATVLRAVERGITSIDLATGYGGGAVERAFGEVLRNDLASHRKSLVVATKAGWNDGTRTTLTESLERSLTQIGVDHVDVYYHHAPDAKTPVEETAEALHDLVRAGKTRYVGVSNYSLAETVRMAWCLKRLGTPCVLHQCNYNMLNRWVEDGLLQGLPALGMRAAIFSALSQGLLSEDGVAGPRAGSRAAKTLEAIVAGVPTGEPAYGRYAAGDVRAQITAMLGRLREIAHGRGQTLEGLALTWVLRHEVVATALVGLSSEAQVDAAADAMAAPPLTEEERRTIAAILPPRWGMV